MKLMRYFLSLLLSCGLVLAPVTTAHAGLETGTYISDLVSTNPVAGDPVSQGDDHVRLLKSTILATFPNVTGAVTKTHTQLNAVPRGYIAGLTLSTAGSSATFAVAAGEATDSGTAVVMLLAASLSKTTSAWAVGTGNGGLDTGVIANSTWYHVYLIRRPDTGVVDAIVSTSASSPTLPANYTQYRRIGAMKTNGSAQWTAFKQHGDDFYWDTPVLDVDIAAVAASALTTFTVPTGVRVKPKLSVSVGMSGTSANSGLVAQLGNGDVSTSVTDVVSVANGPNNTQATSVVVDFTTDTSARLYFALVNAGVTSLDTAPIAAAAVAAAVVKTRGWADSRGKDS